MSSHCDFLLYSYVKRLYQIVHSMLKNWINRNYQMQWDVWGKILLLLLAKREYKLSKADD